jgi:hypothetical protein
MTAHTDTQQPQMNFQGETFDAARDGKRLSHQLEDVRRFMLLSDWVTLSEISEATGAPEASCSARLRDLRTPRGGSFIISRRYVSKGLHEYRLTGKAE